jgi:ParB-like chromosome segregation protein Spo0J
MLMPALHVETRAIASLKPNPRNARTHSKKQVRQIAESIRVFGFTNPVLIDDGDGIIAGHGRIAAAKLLGFSEVPVIRLSAMTEAEKRAYVIADNKLALNAGWDEDLLALELGELAVLDLDFDLTLTGFEMAEIDLLIDGRPGHDRPPTRYQRPTLPPCRSAGRATCGFADPTGSSAAMPQSPKTSPP